MHPKGKSTRLPRLQKPQRVGNHFLCAIYLYLECLVRTRAKMLEQYRKAWIERQVGMTEKAAIEAEIQGDNSHFMRMVELTGAIPSVSAVLRSAFGEPDRFVTPRVAPVSA